MAGVRSPNYPNHSLGQALELAKKIYEADGRNKVSRITISAHLGHESLSGPALGKIGALRAYGLLVGSGDELKVSDDAVAALMAPEGSKDKSEALSRLAQNPGIFQDIRKAFPTTPSKQNLTYWLIQQGFSTSAAAIAANCYLETGTLVDSLGPQYTAGKEGPPTTPPPPEDQKKQEIPAKSEQRKIVMEPTERELTTGLLSKTAGFRLLVTGSIGAKEIDRLIAKLQLDKEILAEPDQDPEESGGDS